MKNQHQNLLSKYTNLTSVFTTREGGRSQKPYESNNLAFHVGDKEEDVLRNHRMLARPLRYNPANLVHMRQIHSTKVHLVSENDNFENPPECDALITNILNKPLMVMTADCVPILIYDDTEKTIAVVHAGREGALNNIVKNTVEALNTHFNSQAENLVIVLGPSIHVCCYEIGEDLAKTIEKTEYASALEFRDEKTYLNVPSIILSQLEQLGVKKENIESLEICSACQNDTYFSYRADNQTTGRNAGILMLKD